MEKELPDRWCWAELDDVGYWIGGGTPSKAKSQFWTSGEIPWVSPKDMKTFRIIDTEDHLSTVAIEEANLKLCPVGTILVVVRSGILLRKLPVAVSQVPLTINQDMKGICPGYNISSNYIAYYLIASTHDILSHCSKDGTTVTSLESGALKSYPIPLAPLNEQRRIVAAIEQQFSRLDAAVESLNHARKKLKRERAAILKAAVEGRLTEQWRAEHPVEETGSQLLQRILAEKRAKWEADQLAKMRAKGVAPRDEKWKEAYREPEMPDTTGLLELPEGWVWAVFEQICEHVTVGHVGPMRDEYVDEGIPFLRGQNVRPNQFHPDGLKFVSHEFHRKLAKSALAPGDILVVRSGSVGTTCVMPDTYKVANCSDLVIVKRPIYINPFYASYYMNSTAQDRIRAQQVGIALTHFNTQSMAIMPLPLPPLSEQQQIVSEVEARLSIIARTEVEVEANLKRAARLRQAILGEAFAGRLVPQDPEDEPASVLLERIREEREEREGRKKGKGERGNGNGNRNGHGRFVEVSSERVRMDVEDVEQGALW